MFDGQYLIEGQDVYSPWIERGGDNMVFSAELIQVHGSGSKLDVFCFTKAHDDEGDGTLLSQPRLAITSKGVGSVVWTGVNELVRFKIANGASPIDPGSYLLFRSLPVISWYDAVDAT